MRKAIPAVIIALLLTIGTANASPLSLEEMTATAEGRAEFTIAGMEESAYQSAADSGEEWIEIVRAREPKALTYDISAYYEWQDIESLLFDMSSHEIASLHVIGETRGGRRIYSVAVGKGERTILLTGGVHAKEPAGTSYILSQLCELVNAWESGDDKTREMLSRFRVVAVPCCNPDGRVILEQDNATDWRANGAGIDLGRNFPSANAGQLAIYAHQAYHATEPGVSEYPGATLGSEEETRALIGWLERYIDSAALYVNLEQYGRYIHSVGSYLSEGAQARSDALAADLSAYLSQPEAAYTIVAEDEPLRGWGSGSILDFASELAEGLAFSPEYGRLGLRTDDGIRPLCFFSDIDRYPDAYAPRNSAIAMVTIELSTKGGAAYYENARRNHLKEYQNCGFDALIDHLMEYASQTLAPGEP